MPFGWAPRALWFRVGLYNTRCPDGGHRAEMVIRPTPQDLACEACTVVPCWLQGGHVTEMVIKTPEDLVCRACNVVTGWLHGGH